MNTCPHCGASLREHARFCPACMTSLVNKQVIPTPRYIPRRWLSVTAAVLVLVLALWGVRMIPSQPKNVPVTAVIDTTTAGTTTAATADTTAADTTATQSTTDTDALTTTDGMVTPPVTTLTTLAESFATDSPYTTRPPWIYTTTTTGTTGLVPPFLTTTGKTSTTTKKTTKPTTTTTTTRPYWQDVTPGSFTEDGLVIEEVNWTYEPIASGKLYLQRCYDDYPNTIYDTLTVTETHSGVPLNQCIKVTGFDAPTSNGIYRVPAIIDGKIVAAVDFGDSFADTEVALAAKRIYLPPDMVALLGGISTCTNLEGVYVTGPKAWFKPSTFPDRDPTWWGGNKVYYLTVYVLGDFYPTYISNFSPPVWTYACNGHCYNVQQGWISRENCTLLYGGGDV